MSDLSVQIGSLKLEHPLMNGAGTCKQPNQVIDHARSATAAVVVGSITLHGRDGNEGEVYWSGGLNSLGMPNPGAVAWDRSLAQLQGQIQNERYFKPIVASVAGFTADEYVSLAQVFVVRGGVEMLELNCGCPNPMPGEVGKRILSFQPMELDDVLARVEKCVQDPRLLNVHNQAVPVSVKLSPYSDPGLLQEVAAVIRGRRIVRAVVTMNTFPNALAVDENGRPRITPNKGLAGRSGPAIKEIALGQVAQFRDALPDDVAVIGVGGIQCGQDVKDFLSVGAIAVQAVTVVQNGGVKELGRILAEYTDLIGAS